MLATPACAMQDKPIAVDKLPEKARTFIAQHFADSKIALSTVDREVFNTTYEVVFSNGDKVEFDRRGEWTDIDCTGSRVPDGAVPQSIRDYIGANYPGQYVKEIDRDSRYYEVKLDNRVELKFDLKFNLVGLDR